MVKKPVKQPVKVAKPGKASLGKVTTVAGYTPTEEQAAILKAVQAGHRVVVIEAGAGTGKTSTLRMIGEVMKGFGQYTAFNSSLVNDSREKFEGTKVSCNTTHSLAFKAEGKRFGHRLNGPRIRSEQIAEMLKIKEFQVKLEEVEEPKRLAPGFLGSLVMGAIRKFCQSADKAVDTKHFKYVDGIDMPTEDGGRTSDNNKLVRKYLLPYAKKAWADLSDENGTLPFTHDHYVKIWQLNKPEIFCDYILLDESQDTAPVMLDVLAQQKEPMIILVGDSAQQIYEWRGAVNAMASFPKAPRLMLSQSFRFGQAIADVANGILKDLEEPTPLRLKGLPSIDSKVEETEDPTAILCRTNAVAVSSLLGAIAEGKKPFLIGGGSEVIAFVAAAKCLQEGKSTSHPELACFNSWSEVQEYVKQDEGEDLKLMVKLIDSFGAEEILAALRAMPAEEDADLVISTAHKSKGREWDRVKVASDFLPRSKCGDADRKLLYVTVTRAKQVLDITGCPYFKAETEVISDKAIEASLADSASKHKEALGAAVSLPAKGAGGEYTWAKGRDGKTWLVRGPAGHVGEYVDVVRKDGSTQKKYLAAVEYEFDDGVLYRV